MKIEKRFLEISQATNPNGRRRVKIILHEIYPDNTRWNRNGISYLEQYTRDNADTVKGMPLCAEFLDEDKEVPYGHGLTGQIQDMPVFEDSVQVGVFDDWSIEDIELEDGMVHRCLCGVGYINEARYPKFVKWIEDQIADGDTIYGSVEFVGTKENNGEIIYDGGWKETGRIPMIYDYSGYCLLSITPSDSSAVLIELNQFNRKNLEVIEMNEEMKKTLSDLKADIISEFQNTRKAEVNSQVEDLKSEITELNSEIAELNSAVVEKEDKISELNQKCEQLEKEAKEKEDEFENKKKELNAVIESQAAELDKIKKENKVAELNSALSVYSDEQKSYAKDEIEAFNADPFSVEINSIVTKIDATAYQKIREENARKALEVNSMKDEFDGILSAVDPVINDDKSVDDFDCFA